MNIRDWLDEEAGAFDESVMVLEGWDHAIVGLLRDKQSELHIVYDREVIITDLSKDMGWEDAEGFFSYNIEGLVPNPGGPLFVQRPPSD